MWRIMGSRTSMHSAIDAGADTDARSHDAPASAAGQVWPVFFLALLLIGGLSACKNVSGIEGRVHDGKGLPLAGIVLVAKDIAAVEGYEQFAARTGADGAFSFKGLKPSTRYLILPRSKQWMTEAKFVAESGGLWRTASLPDPFVIRFTVQSQVITDSRTGSEWIGDAGYERSWTGARALMEFFNRQFSGATPWRLPNADELAGIYDFRALDKSIRIDDIFHLRSYRVWTGESVDYRQSPEAYYKIMAGLSMSATPFGSLFELSVNDPASHLRSMASQGADMSLFAKYFDFSTGGEQWTKDRDGGVSIRILAVRTPADTKSGVAGPDNADRPLSSGMSGAAAVDPSIDK